MHCLQRHYLPTRAQAILALLLLASFFPSASAQNDAQRLAQLKEELNELNQRLQEYQQERGSVQSEIRAQELELSGIHRRIYDADRSISTTQSRLTKLESDEALLESKRLDQERALVEDIGRMHRSGNEEPLKMLLNQTNPNDFSRMLVYYRHLLEARAQSIDEYIETTQQLAETKDNVVQQRERLESLKTELAAQETALATAQDIKTSLLEQLESRIVSAEQQIAEKEEDSARLSALIQEVEERIASLAPPDSYKPFAELKGSYSLPVSGSIAHRYGSNRTGALSWQGIVVSSPAGTRVNSIHYGRVVFADYLRGYGLLVIVDHDGGYMTLYGHNQSLFVEPGDWVGPKDQIAMVGNSGGITSTGLYFEIRYEGKPQNPSSWTSR